MRLRRDAVGNLSDILTKFTSTSCACRYLVQVANPTFNESQVEALARSEFNTAAMEWFVATLQLSTSLRPSAKWGFYGLPSNPYGPCVNSGPVDPQCGYRNPLVGPALKAINDAILPIYNASTGIYPSIYIPEGTNTSFWQYMTADYVSGTTEEAVRLANATSKLPIATTPHDASTATVTTSVRPFAWSFYHDGIAPLLPADLNSSLANPQAVGADGVVLWGAPASFNHVQLFAEYLNTTLGPLALQILAPGCSN
jgi:hypothetical protein